MERRESEVERDPVTGTVREERHVTSGPVDDPVAPRAPAAPMMESSEVVSGFNPARRGVELIYLIFGVIVGLLIIRVVLKLLAANPAAGFSNFVYGITNVFLAPFKNLLPTVGTGQSQLEMSVVIAILVYVLIAWALARLMMVMFARNVSVARSSRSSMRPRGD